MRIRTGGAALCIWVSLLVVHGSFADDFKVKSIEKKAPEEIGESLRKELQPEAVQLLDGDAPVLEFWFRSYIPLEAKPEKARDALGKMKETTLIGIVAVHRKLRDYQDGGIPEGLYTMRLGIQPEDGDHLGTSDYEFFAVLIPAMRDKEVDGIKDHKTLTKTSKKGTPTEHPIVLSLRPVSTPEKDLPKIAEPADDHKSLRVRVPAKTLEHDEKFDIVFDLVYEGVADF